MKSFFDKLKEQLTNPAFVVAVVLVAVIVVPLAVKVLRKVPGADKIPGLSAAE